MVEPIVQVPGVDADPLGNETRDIQSAIEELRVKVSVPKGERQGDWEDSTASLVAMIAADFQAQEDDAIALRELVAVIEAARTGCVAAKKRMPSPVRWRAKRPPSLATVYASESALKETIRTLAGIRAEWVVAYVADQIHVGLSPACRQELLRWAVAGTRDVDALLVALRGPLDPAVWESVESTVHALQDALKAGAFRTLGHGQDIARELSELFGTLRDAVMRTAPSASSKTKAIAELQSFLVTAIDSATSVAPSLVANPKLPVLIVDSRLGGKTWPKKLSDSIGNISRRSANQLLSTMSVAKPEVIDELVGIGMALQSQLPAFDKHVRTAIGMPLKEYAASLKPESRDGRSEMAELESALSQFIPRWEDYRNGHQEDLDVSQLDEHIMALGDIVGVSRFGQRGEIIDYQPLRHHLVEVPDMPPERVLLLKSGVLVKRRDGSERILLRALTQAV